MTVTEIAAEHGVTRQTVHTHRKRGVFPKPVEGEGSTRPRFRADEVAAFFAANPPTPGKRTDLPAKQQGEPAVSTQQQTDLSRVDDRDRTQLYDTAVLVEQRWPGEYSALCRDLRDLGDKISEEAAE
jgi:hypothetical protein